MLNLLVSNSYSKYAKFLSCQRFVVKSSFRFNQVSVISYKYFQFLCEVLANFFKFHLFMKTVIKVSKAKITHSFIALSRATGVGSTPNISNVLLMNLLHLSFSF